MSPFHEYLRRATRDQHSRLDAHPLMVALLQPDLTAAVYEAALRGLGMALLDVEPVVDRAHTACAQLLSLPMLALAHRLPSLNADLANLGAQPCGGAVSRLQIDSIAELAGALYVLEGSRLGGQLLARKLQAHGPWPSLFFEAGGASSVLRWKQFIQWAADVVTEPDFALAATAAVRVFDVFAHRLDESAHVLWRGA